MKTTTKKELIWIFGFSENIIYIYHNGIYNTV